MVTCPEVIDTSNMPALIEDTRPDPAVEYHLRVGGHFPYS